MARRNRPATLELHDVRDLPEGSAPEAWIGATRQVLTGRIDEVPAAIVERKSDLIRRAENFWDLDRQVEAGKWAGKLRRNPLVAAAMLRANSFGLTWMSIEIEALRRKLQYQGKLSEKDRERLATYFGHHPETAHHVHLPIDDLYMVDDTPTTHADLTLQAFDRAILALEERIPAIRAEEAIARQRALEGRVEDPELKRLSRELKRLQGALAWLDWSEVPARSVEGPKPAAKRSLHEKRLVDALPAPSEAGDGPATPTGTAPLQTEPSAAPEATAQSRTEANPSPPQAS